VPGTLALKRPDEERSDRFRHRALHRPEAAATVRGPHRLFDGAPPGNQLGVRAIS